MSTLNNSVTLIGNLGKDIEITNLPSGAVVGKTSLATNKFYMDKNGEKVQKVEWHPIVVWNKTAELMEKICKKGNRVMVKGELNHDSYKNKDGEMRYSTQVKIFEFQNFTPKDEKLPF